MLLTALLAAAAIAALTWLAHPGTPGHARSGPAVSPAQRGSRGAGTAARFALLSRRTSNQCSLKPGDLMKYQRARRLQGSCCSAMDMAAYLRQVAALRRYAAIRQIPADPYDIPAGLAQQLIGYQHALRLTAAQQRIYDTAMRLTPEKGPCCCRCWRWTAFQGLARYLVSDRGWQAPTLAALISDLDGCGGSDHPAGMVATGMGASPDARAGSGDGAG
jgi:hypothetical protein